MEERFIQKISKQVRYSETTTDITNGAARVVTLFSGLLEFDGDAWLSLIDWNAFDKKVGKSLAMMFCTNSAEELQESIDQVEMLLDVFSPEGKAGEMLRNKQLRIDNDVTVWKKACEEYLELLEDGSGSPTKYNLLYRQYERAMDDQSLFAALGGDDVIYIQDELSSAANVLDIASKIGSAVSYFSEFQQKDTYQISVLKNYLSTRSQTVKIPEATATSMMKYISSTDDAGQYVFSRFLEENALELIVDKSGLDAYLGAPANILLLAWDIMSGTIPFYSEGLKAIENREISNYAQKMQNDAFLNLGYLLSKMRSNTTLSREECVQLSEYCYVYLKACYIARSAAIKSLDNTSEEFQEEIKGKIDVETDINKIIAEYLAVLSNADNGNECYSLGFLPEDNDRYLSDYSDEVLIEAVDFDDRIDSDSLVTDAYMDVIIDGNNIFCYHIPQVNLKGNRGSAVNHTMYDQLYNILATDVYPVMEKYNYPELSEMVYTWGQNGDLISIVVETNATTYAWTDYYVYTISADTGKIITQEEVLALYGYDSESFLPVAYAALKSNWDGRLDFRDRVGKEWFDDRVEKTLSEQNLRDCIPFIAPDGSLGFVARIYSLAAGDSYYHLMYAKNDATNSWHIECQIDHTSAQTMAPTDDPLEYFIENCDRVYFSEEDVANFDDEMCVYARNAIYAKSGWAFNDQELKQYFSRYSWYSPSVNPSDFTEDMLNDYQIANRNLIIRYEDELENPKAETNEWKELYIKYIEEHDIVGRNNAYYIAYVDDDNVPEIFLSSGSASPGEIILWIANGSVNQEDSIGYGQIHYYEKQGIFCTSWLNHGNYADAIYELKEGVLQLTHRGRIKTDWDNPDTPSTYSWDDVVVSKEQYDNKLESAFIRETAIEVTFNYEIEGLVSAIQAIENQ